MTPSQLALIKATIPLLETGGEALATHFYQRLLHDHAELKPMFNPAHQASGAQPRALANGILMYARHIENLATLGPLVAQIIHKHVSLQVLPEHYPLVGNCLLRAIRDVLGAEVATDAVIDAWAAAYGQLSAILIGAEEGLYVQKAEAPGGWRGARTFRVAEKVVESEEIVSLRFEPVDGGPVLIQQPGQFISLLLNIHGESVRRNYSLSSRGNGRDYRISVKREVLGKVSGYLHEQLQVGDHLDLAPPSGDFVLADSPKPLVLITAGVGITPALPMLEVAMEQGREIVFVHCARHGGVQAFRGWLEEQARRYPKLTLRFCYSAPRSGDAGEATGHLQADYLAAWLPATRDVDAYFLGPLPFMRAVKGYLGALGVPAAQCHYECFGPAASLDSADAA